MSYLKSVEKFHRTFKHPILNVPTIPAEERCKLRIALLEEELEELKWSIKDKNIVEIADALCDIQYVLSGAILEFGLGQIFQELFDEVQKSNMSKACQTKLEAEDTIIYYKDYYNTEAIITQVDNLFLVTRKSDNKVLKSIQYTPASLERLVRKNRFVNIEELWPNLYYILPVAKAGNFSVSFEVYYDDGLEDLKEIKKMLDALSIRHFEEGGDLIIKLSKPPTYNVLNVNSLDEIKKISKKIKDTIREKGLPKYKESPDSRSHIKKILEKELINKHLKDLLIRTSQYISCLHNNEMVTLTDLAYASMYMIK